jgi:hypothetical protein
MIHLRLKSFFGIWFAFYIEYCIELFFEQSLPIPVNGEADPISSAFLPVDPGS